MADDQCDDASRDDEDAPFDEALAHEAEEAVRQATPETQAEADQPVQEPREPADDGVEESGADTGSSASTVAGGILSSRIMGFVREGSLAYFFGVGAHADVLQAAFKAPNLLQNLLGEGTISAAFIPIYSKLLEEGKAEEAGRFAGAIFGLLLAVASLFAFLGVVFAEEIVTVYSPGFRGDAADVLLGKIPIDRFALSVTAVKIIFPMTAVLVLSAWALGVLNSHRRFFLPYFAPVLWNTAIIASLVTAMLLFVGNPLKLDPEVMTTDGRTTLLMAAFWGALVGGVLQFGVQLPLVGKLMTGFKLSFSTKAHGVKEALSAFGPVVAGRGVYQVSAFIDTLLASLLAAGALSSLRFSQMLYLLPVSLFGMSVAASELPELSRISTDQADTFLARLDRSMRQMLFMTIPTFVGYIAFGLLIVGAIFRRGSFGLNDTWLVYLALAGYALGLIATTVSRLLQNAFYAFQETKTPAKIAVVRVVVSAAISIPLMFWLDQFNIAKTFGFLREGHPLFLGAVGLSVGSAFGAWVELWRLRSALRAHLEHFVLPWASMARLTGTALVALVPGAFLWWLLPSTWSMLALAPLVVGAFGVTYLAVGYALGFEEGEAWIGKILRRFR